MPSARALRRQDLYGRVFLRANIAPPPPPPPPVLFAGTERNTTIELNFLQQKDGAELVRSSQRALTTCPSPCRELASCAEVSFCVSFLFLSLHGALLQGTQGSFRTAQLASSSLGMSNRCPPPPRLTANAVDLSRSRPILPSAALTMRATSSVGFGFRV